MSRTSIRCLAFASALAAAVFATAASANPLEFFPFGQPFSYQQREAVPAPPFARDSGGRESYSQDSYARDSYDGAQQGDRYRPLRAAHLAIPEGEGQPLQRADLQEARPRKIVALPYQQSGDGGPATGAWSSQR